MIGVSRCLIGETCTYKGSHNLVKGFQKLYQQGKVIPVCPEVLGGLPIPRFPSEIISQNPLVIKNNHGEDVTKEYLDGANKAIQIFLDNHVDVAVLKYRSPSCGNDGVYDGTFSHHLIEGQGVFAKMCKQAGIQVFNENEIDKFLKYIGKEEEYGTYFKDSTSI